VANWVSICCTTRAVTVSVPLAGAPRVVRITGLAQMGRSDGTAVAARVLSMRQDRCMHAGHGAAAVAVMVVGRCVEHIEMEKGVARPRLLRRMKTLLATWDPQTAVSDPPPFVHVLGCSYDLFVVGRVLPCSVHLCRRRPARGTRGDGGTATEPGWWDHQSGCTLGERTLHTHVVRQRRLDTVAQCPRSSSENLMGS